MRILYFLQLFLFSVCLLAQKQASHVTKKPEIILKGYLRDSYDTSTPVTKGIVQVRADTVLYKYITDSTGYYEFRFPAAKYKKLSLYVSTDRSTKSKYTYPGYYFASRDTLEYLILRKSSGFFAQIDIYLERIACCGDPLFKFIFKKNSIVPDTIQRPNFYTEDSIYRFPLEVMTEIAELMKENKTMIVELAGHSSTNEDLPQQLSELRAERIKAGLMALGIDEKRIIAKGRGSTRPIIPDSIIKKAKTTQDKAKLHSINRRCTYRFLSQDYKRD